MRKIKPLLILALTAAVVLGMAVLPWATEAMDDSEKSGTAPIQPVRLDIRGDDTMLRKLVLQARMTTIPVTAESARMTEAEVWAAVEKGLQIYEDTGLFSEMEPSFQSLEPYLGIDPEDRSNYAIFWSVTLTDEGRQSLFLHVDDETGKILLLIYDNYEESRTFTGSGGRALAERLAHAFLTPLELHLSQLESRDGLVGNVATEETVEQDGVNLIYVYQDTPYGTVRVGFVVSPTRAYVYYPG